MENNQQYQAYTYMVECEDGSLYTGWTDNLIKRMYTHNQGKGAKYTRSRLPVRLVYYEMHSSKQDAMKREYAIKQLPRKDKLLLIGEADMEQQCAFIMEKSKQN